MELETENEVIEIANAGAAKRTGKVRHLTPADADERPCPAPSYPSGCADEGQYGSYLPTPLIPATLTRKILKGLLLWATNPKSGNTSLSKLRYGRKILGASAPSEGMKAIHWARAKDADLLFRQHTKSELDFGEPLAGQTRIVDGEMFDVIGNGTRKQIPFVCDLTRKEFTAVTWSERESGHRRKAYDASLKVKAGRYDTEAELKKAMGDDYYPPEISPDRLVTTSRETTRGRYTDETVVIKSIPEYEKWRKAILLQFGGKPVDSDFTDGLYMLVERPQQPPRVCLLIDASDFQAPDEWVYIGTDQFKTARAAMAESTGFAIRYLLKCPSRVLSFGQNGPEIKVTISDCEMFEDEYMGKKMSRAKQIPFNQQVVAENAQR
jgi:hypothetical protein